MKPKTDFEPDNKPFIKSEGNYSDYVADYDSNLGEFQGVKDECWDGVNQVKTENQLAVEVKSEKPDADPFVDNMKFENIDTLTLNDDIKCEYDEDAISDLTCDRIKIEEKFLPGIETDWTVDTVDQTKVGFQELETVKEKPLLNFENTDASELHQEFDIKIESNQHDEHDPASDSAQIKRKCSVTHIKGKHLRSSSEKCRSVFRKPNEYVCIKCDEVFKNKMLLDNHAIRKHIESVASVSSKIHECTFCDYKTVFKRYLSGHMLIHTNTKVSDLHICKHCNTSFKAKQSLFDHILEKHPNFSGTVARKIYECLHCAFKTTGRSRFIRHMSNHNSQKPFECINCGAAFKSKVLLDNHVIRKHAESIASVSSEIYECEFCDYKTVVKRYLPMHMLIHTSSKVSDLHICKHCNMSFKAKQSLLDHILKKHPNFSGTVSRKIYECMHCAFKTTRRGAFITHMAKHNSQKPFECINCDASFKTKQGFDDHILRKHPDFTASVSHKILECTQCEYKATRADNLARHITKHTRVNLPCTKCDAAFKNIDLLDNHILQKHPEFTASVSRKIHECAQCEYKTTRSGYLARHMKKHAKLTCAKCNVSFTFKPSLDNHILQKHPEFAACVSSKIHKCTHCEYKTAYVRCLAMHMMKHTGAKLPCTKCDALFTCKRSLDHHILQKHPELTDSVSSKVHECTHCEYKTTNAKHLATHMMKHTGAKFTCAQCDASFANKQPLDNHILQKHPELTASVSSKIHECKQCEYKTTYTKHLAIHMLKHTEARLKCTKCDASFTCKQSLDDHILQKHPELTASVSSN